MVAVKWQQSSHIDQLCRDSDPLQIGQHRFSQCAGRAIGDNRDVSALFNHIRDTQWKRKVSQVVRHPLLETVGIERLNHQRRIITAQQCIAESVLPDLERIGISAELIDVRTLLPFDRNHLIVDSLRKTGRILFLDEDVPGGATAYMMQKVIEEQGGYRYLDSPPSTLTAKAHRPAFATDGDYFSKPNREDIFEKVYAMLHEAAPGRYPSLR